MSGSKYDDSEGEDGYLWQIIRTSFSQFFQKPQFAGQPPRGRRLDYDGQENGEKGDGGYYFRARAFIPSNMPAGLRALPQFHGSST